MVERLTRERALELHRQMWSDMQKELGDCPRAWDRINYKHDWCFIHGYKNVESNCFLCEYVDQHDPHPSGSCKSHCLIQWKYGTCVTRDYYYEAPISEILALPEREVEND